MAIFDTSYFILGILGVAVFFAAQRFLGSLREREAGAKAGPAATPVAAAPTASQKFISDRTRGFNLPRADLAKLAVLVPAPSLAFGDLDLKSQELMRESYGEGQSRGPEATAFLFGEPLSEKNAVYIAWFKDYAIPHFFVDRRASWSGPAKAAT